MKKGIVHFTVTAFGNEYIIRLYLSNHSRSVRFTKIVENGKVRLGSVLLSQTGPGVAEVKYIVPRGGIVMEKLKIRAEYKTSLGNLFVLEQVINVAVDRY